MRSGFVIHHNGPPANCLGRPHSRCVAYWNAVKSFHVGTKGWSDIAYSFGVCPHGTRFVGRGWDKPQFANGEDVVGPEDGSDAHWFTVLVFLGWEEIDGQPVDEEPTAAMVAGVRSLIAEGRLSRRCGTRVLPHNAFKIKRCPGATFTAYAAAWDNQPLTPTAPPEDDMTDAESAAQAEMLVILRTLAKGSTSTIAKMWRDLKAVATAVDAIDVDPDLDEAQLAAELAPLLHDLVPQLNDADLERIAEAVADEHARRAAA